MANHYEKWECFKAGLYKTQCAEWEERMEACANILRSEEVYNSMTHVADNWTNSVNHYFNENISTWRPWLGHSSCCFETGAPNWVTKKAWHTLRCDEQMRANRIAELVHKEWCEKNGVGHGQAVLI